MTTKFAPGTRVRVYERSQSVDGTVDGIWPDGSIRVKLDAGTGTISYHHKQLRRLVKRNKVVWESKEPIIRPAGIEDFGILRIEDAAELKKVLTQFIGKRVRIVIAEARGKK